MIGYGSTNTHTCDNCKKLIPKWEVRQLIDRKYSPGKKYNTCSSDIKTSLYKIVELCPECMNEVYETYGVLCEERED